MEGFPAVGEGQCTGIEHGFGLGGTRAILMVAHQGEATAGELHADLVASAGMQLNAHQRSALGSLCEGAVTEGD